jgi:hypothetical protein
MPARRKKPAKRVDKAQLQKQLRLVTQEAKKLDADIKDLTRTLTQSNYRVL